MSGENADGQLSPRVRDALKELEGLVREHYPEAEFQVSRSPEGPEIVHLNAKVDVDDIDAVLAVVVDCVMEMQIEEGLSLYVIPTRPRERVIADLTRSRSFPVFRRTRFG